MSAAEKQQSVLSWLIPRLYSGTEDFFAAAIVEMAQGSTLQIIFTPNPEQVELAERNISFLRALQHGDVFLPDGNGLIWAAQRLGSLDVSRVSGRGVLEKILFFYTESRRRENLPRILLLGGLADSAPLTAKKFDSTGKKILGIPGFSDANQPTTQEDHEFWNTVSSWKPEVIFVGFGAPKQEQWSVENAQKLQVAGVRVLMVVGGAFDVLSGKLQAPPSWVTYWKLEWLFRLVQEPGRWRRQIWLPRFVWRVLFQQS